jgi:signal peptidase I
MSRWIKLLIVLGLIPAFCFTAVIVLRLCGLICPFYIPTGAMAPAVSAGDSIMMENVSFHFRQPRRGDIVVFKTDGIVPVSPTRYIKRIAGEPGEHVQISGGELFINGTELSLSNAAGKIVYDSPSMPGSWTWQTNIVVPRGCYFVLGDNSTNSYDSRFWGSLPRENIIGRVSFCFWPPDRAGGVK